MVYLAYSPRPRSGSSGAARVFGILADEEEAVKLSDDNHLYEDGTAVVVACRGRGEKGSPRAHPPASMTIRSMEGTLRWRRCLTCAEQSGSSLTIVAPANGAMTEGNSDPEYFVTGCHELNSNGAPSFYLSSR